MDSRIEKKGACLGSLLAIPTRQKGSRGTRDPSESRQNGRMRRPDFLPIASSGGQSDYHKRNRAERNSCRRKITAINTASTETVDKRGDRVRAMFASIARRYDFLNHLLSLNIDRRWRSFAIKTVPPPLMPTCSMSVPGQGTSRSATLPKNPPLASSASIFVLRCLMSLGRRMIELPEMCRLVREMRRHSRWNRIDSTSLPVPLACGMFQIPLVASTKWSVLPSQAEKWQSS